LIRVADTRVKRSVTFRFFHAPRKPSRSGKPVVSTTSVGPSYQPIESPIEGRTPSVRCWECSRMIRTSWTSSTWMATVSGVWMM
jgi:hypothetical protein